MPTCMPGQSINFQMLLRLWQQHHPLPTFPRRCAATWLFNAGLQLHGRAKVAIHLLPVAAEARPTLIENEMEHCLLFLIIVARADGKCSTITSKELQICSTMDKMQMNHNSCYDGDIVVCFLAATLS